MNRVKELREKKRIKQVEFANKLGITNDYLSKIELGKQTPGFKLAAKIANEFGTSIDSLNFFNE